MPVSYHTYDRRINMYFICFCVCFKFYDWADVTICYIGDLPTPSFLQKSTFGDCRGLATMSWIMF